MEEFDLQRIRLGDTKAFRPFFDHYSLALKRFAMKYLQDRDAVKDIVQETMIKFWDRRKRFDNLYAAKSFLFITTRNSLLDELRHRKVVTEAQQQIRLSGGSEMEKDFIKLYEEDTAQNVYKRLEAEISQLPPRTQEVIRLQIAGYRSAEIAEFLGVGRETVKTLKKYGMSKLKNKMSFLVTDWQLRQDKLGS